MKANNKVSIIVTVKNEEKSIKQLFVDLLSQTYRFDEVVIVDAGSTDSTIDIISEFQKTDPRVKMFIIPGCSIGDGMNAAMRESEGDIFAFIDAGIKPQPTWLEKIMYPLLQDSTVDVVFGQIVFETGNDIIQISDIQKLLVFLTRPNAMQKHKYVPSSAVRREVMESVGGFAHTPYCEDQVFFNALEQKSFKSVYVRDAICYYYDQPKKYSVIYKKWKRHNTYSTLYKVAYHGFYRQLVKRVSYLLIAGVFLIMTVIDFKWITVLLVLFLFQVFRRSMVHKDIGAEILKKPTYWFKLIALLVVLDAGRISGFIAGCRILLKRKLFAQTNEDITT